MPAVASKLVSYLEFHLRSTCILHHTWGYLPKMQFLSYCNGFQLLNVSSCLLDSLNLSYYMASQALYDLTFRLSHGSCNFSLDLHRPATELLAVPRTYAISYFRVFARAVIPFGTLQHIHMPRWLLAQMPALVRCPPHFRKILEFLLL